jgi:uncharacterized membrane protein (UPF0127 family)
MSWIRALCLGAVLALGGAACAQSETAAPATEQTQRLPVESLTVETASGARRFEVEIADDEPERNRGLMFRREMARDHGMLFDFNPPERVNFWMRNTHLPLDIIFIGADGRIINIAENTTPYSDAQIPAHGLTRGVLEINAGLSRELGIAPGDHVRHRIFQH